NATGNATSTAPMLTAIPPSAVDPVLGGQVRFGSLAADAQYLVRVQTLNSVDKSAYATLTCATPPTPPATVSSSVGFSSTPLVFSVVPTSGPQTGNTTVTVFGAFFGNKPTELLDIRLAGVSCQFTKRWINNATVSCVSEASATGITGIVTVSTFAGVSS